MRYFLMTFLVFAFGIMPNVSAHAEDNKIAVKKEEKAVRECRKDIQDATRTYWELLRQMADFKAAIDAGYDGCSQTYPDKFNKAGEYYDFWKENTGTEYEQAFEVVDKLTDEQFDEMDKLGTDCDEKDILLDKFKVNMRETIDGFYDKAHKRRVKILVGDGLSGTGENTFLDFDKNDSCKSVLETLEGYRKWHDTREEARFALYTFATQKSPMAHQKSRKSRKALEAFDKERKKITPSVFGD